MTDPRNIGLLIETRLLLAADPVAAAMNALLVDKGFEIKPQARGRLQSHGMVRATLVWRNRQVGRSTTFNILIRLGALA